MIADVHVVVDVQASDWVVEVVRVRTFTIGGSRHSACCQLRNSQQTLTQSVCVNEKETISMQERLGERQRVQRGNQRAYVYHCTCTCTTISEHKAFSMYGRVSGSVFELVVKVQIR